MMGGSQASSSMTMRVFLVAFALATVSLAVGSAAPDALVYARLESYLDALRVQTGIPGLSAAIVGDTDIVWERGFGRQDLGKLIATQPDTPFHIDSLGQTLTAALVLRCVDQGKLTLDDPVGTYDPASPEAGATIRQLLAHLSGGPAARRSATSRSGWNPCGTPSSAPATVPRVAGHLFDSLAMRDSVPGADAMTLRRRPRHSRRGRRGALLGGAGEVATVRGV